MNLATYIMNFKKIGSKLWPWQCPRGRIQNGCRDVINYANEPKLKRTPLDLWGTILWKFGWNRPSSFAILARTDRHTHRHTDRQTPPGFPDPNDHNTFSQWKWLNVKIAGCQRLHFFLYFKKIGIKLWLLECACCDVQIWPLWRHNLCKWFKSEMRTPRTLADIFG